MPALPLSDDLQCGSTITFFSNRSMQRIRVFLSANEPILGRLVSHCWDSLPTFLVMQSRQRWAHLELQKVKMSQTLKAKKKARSSFVLILTNSRRRQLLHQTGLKYTILLLLRNLTYLQLCPSFGFSSLLQLSLLLWPSFREVLQSCSIDNPTLNSILYYTVLCSTFLTERQSASSSL